MTRPSRFRFKVVTDQQIQKLVTGFMEGPLAGLGPASAASVPAPVSAELLKGKIRYKWAEFRRRDGWARADTRPPQPVPTSFWRTFLRLATAPDGKILEVARKYGPLTPDLPRNEPEEIAYWRQMAGLASAIVRCWHCIDAVRPGADEDWDVVLRYLGESREILFPPTRRNEDAFERTLVLKKSALYRALDKWYGESGRCSLFRTSGGRVLVGPWVGGLRAAIAEQIAHHLARPGCPATCAGCGRRFSASTRPTEGRRTFCAPCRERKIAARDASRRYRARKKAAKPIATIRP